MTEEEFRKGPQSKPFDAQVAIDHIEKRVTDYMAHSGDIRATATDWLLIQVLKELRGMSESNARVEAKIDERHADWVARRVMQDVQDDAESRKRWALTDAERRALMGDLKVGGEAIYGASPSIAEDAKASMARAAQLREKLDAMPMGAAILRGAPGLNGDGIGGTDGSHGNGAALSGGYMACTICGEKFDLGTGHLCATGRKTL